MATLAQKHPRVVIPAIALVVILICSVSFVVLRPIFTPKQNSPETTTTQVKQELTEEELAEQKLAREKASKLKQSQELVDLLVKNLSDSSTDVQAAAIGSLRCVYNRDLDRSKALPHLISLLGDEAHLGRHDLHALIKAFDERGLSAIVARFDTENPNEKISILKTLEYYGTEAKVHIPWVRQHLTSDNANLQAAAISCLKEAPISLFPELITDIIPKLEADEYDVSRAARNFVQHYLKQKPEAATKYFLDLCEKEIPEKNKGRYRRYVCNNLQSHPEVLGIVFQYQDTLGDKFFDGLLESFMVEIDRGQDTLSESWSSDNAKKSARETISTYVLALEQLCEKRPNTILAINSSGKPLGNYASAKFIKTLRKLATSEDPQIRAAATEMIGKAISGLAA